MDASNVVHTWKRRVVFDKRRNELLVTGCVILVLLFHDNDALFVACDAVVAALAMVDEVHLSRSTVLIGIRICGCHGLGCDVHHVVACRAKLHCKGGYYFKRAFFL